ncbi:MAG: hypothetical protein NT056_02450 [Proteobacteria bacterium]|nr:hypothetical protein [Pseudomonadota bacterium]
MFEKQIPGIFSILDRHQEALLVLDLLDGLPEILQGFDLLPLDFHDHLGLAQSGLARHRARFHE